MGFIWRMVGERMPSALVWGAITKKVGCVPFRKGIPVCRYPEAFPESGGPRWCPVETGLSGCLAQVRFLLVRTGDSGAGSMRLPPAPSLVGDAPLSGNVPLCGMGRRSGAGAPDRAGTILPGARASPKGRLCPKARPPGEARTGAPGRGRAPGSGPTRSARACRDAGPGRR